MNDYGKLDVKGLAEWGVGQALGKIPSLSYLTEHVTPLVGLALVEMGVPAMLELGVAGTLLTKAVIAGLARQKEIDTRNAEARKVAADAG